MTAQRYVLVVDDERQLTSFLKEFFSRIGYQMHVASSGQEALDAMKEHIPSLILLDMRMPGIDGVQVLQIVKQKYPSVRVIVMTSYDEE
jgi:two-component system response regulator (stage 0 sporulation protein F)